MLLTNTSNRKWENHDEIQTKSFGHLPGAGVKRSPGLAMAWHKLLALTQHTAFLHKQKTQVRASLLPESDRGHGLHPDSFQSTILANSGESHVTEGDLSFSLTSLNQEKGAERCMLHHLDLVPHHPGPQFISNAQNRVRQGPNSPSSTLKTQCQGERTPSDLLPKRWDQESYYLQKPEDEHSLAVSPQ